VKTGPRLATIRRLVETEVEPLHNEPLTAPSECRALVVLEPRKPAPCAPVRPDAGFLTQLIACERRLPAYRDRRRAEPAEGVPRYGAAAPGPARPVLSRDF